MICTLSLSHASPTAMHAKDWQALTKSLKPIKERQNERTVQGNGNEQRRSRRSRDLIGQRARREAGRTA
ncbi:hypothetical protein BN2476_340032 [Paraburkholderia piptadeniae]|uniref:Uncharacterized protein n=1 Tax=Paraburkholderia piptadeniae TaxID=1701573 RepID=A0A1N7S6H6_9BURK|nr:hypothetical protein BN2476_340032 [Paraburkholderia piptadeniae]